MPRKVKYYSARRRALYAACPPVDRLAIYERDGWVCQLCHEPVNRALRHPAWWSATLDHVVPVSVALERGWSPEQIHSPDNLALSHKRCNELKSNKVDD